VWEPQLGDWYWGGEWEMDVGEDTCFLYWGCSNAVVGQDVGAALLRDTRQDRPLGPRLELGVHGRKRHPHVLG
jgi:hypothetical protein